MGFLTDDKIMKVIENPNILSAKDRAALLMAAMKAQDSRIQATAKVRQDKREEIAFQNVFGNNAYEEENE